MQSEKSNLRYPLTWEANLLVAVVSILVLIGSAMGMVFGLAGTLIFAQAFVIVPALLWIAIRRLPVRTTLRLNPVDGRIAVWSMLIGLACWPVVAGMASLIEQGLALIGPNPQITYPTGLVESVIYAFVLIVLAPVSEEPVFRGFVLRAWLRRGTTLGLVLCGLLFASFHFQLAAFVPLTFWGFVLGLLVHRSNSLYAAMIAHACYNTVGTLFIIVPSLRDITWPLVIVGAITLPITIWLLWSFARRFPVSEAPLAREDSPWIWTVLSLLAVLAITGLVAVSIYLPLQ
ncbi:MAG: CPBP family intramembrane glutamic endopeptidase [Anaerolineae bacterium]